MAEEASVIHDHKAHQCSLSHLGEQRPEGICMGSPQKGLGVQGRSMQAAEQRQRHCTSQAVTSCPSYSTHGCCSPREPDPLPRCETGQGCSLMQAWVQLKAKVLKDGGEKTQFPHTDKCISAWIQILPLCLNFFLSALLQKLTGSSGAWGFGTHQTGMDGPKA